MVQRLEQYAMLPGGIKALRAVIDVVQYRATATCPATFQVPFRMDRIVSSFVLRIGTDYNENAFGSMVYNSSNSQGFLVDGKMDENERNNFNPAFDNWRLLTGPCGTFMTRTMPTPEVKKYATAQMGYIDDITQPDPPESVPGNIGYLYQEWDIGKAPKGKYLMFLDFYWIPNYKLGDEVHYLNFMDNPVRIRVGNKEEASKVLLVANMGKKYK